MAFNCALNHWPKTTNSDIDNCVMTKGNTTPPLELAQGRIDRLNQQAAVAPIKLLHVDDETEWAGLVGSLFAGTAYRIYRASTGVQALGLASRLLPDIVILDVGLPDIPGHKLLERLRKLPGLTRLPAVCFSAHNEEKVRSLLIGADAYVGKTAGGADLLPTVEALMRRIWMDTGIVVKQNLKLDPRDNSVHMGGELVATLTPKEFLFFYTLVNKSPEAITDEQLRRILGESEFHEESRSLVMLATRTRKHLGKGLANRIRGSRRFGWIYSAPPETPANS